jgi:hypothetical protein
MIYGETLIPTRIFLLVTRCSRDAVELDRAVELQPRLDVIAIIISSSRRRRGSSSSRSFINCLALHHFFHSLLRPSAGQHRCLRRPG